LSLNQRTWNMEQYRTRFWNIILILLNHPMYFCILNFRQLYSSFAGHNKSVISCLLIVLFFKTFDHEICLLFSVELLSNNAPLCSSNVRFILNFSFVLGSRRSSNPAEKTLFLDESTSMCRRPTSSQSL
jgi:hypothetical protein